MQIIYWLYKYLSTLGCTVKHLWLGSKWIRCPRITALSLHTPQDPRMDGEPLNSHDTTRYQRAGYVTYSGDFPVFLVPCLSSCFVLFMLMFSCLYSAILVALQLNNELVCLQDPTQNLQWSVEKKQHSNVYASQPQLWALLRQKCSHVILFKDSRIQKIQKLYCHM